MAAAVEDELAGLTRIMGYRHRGDPDVADDQFLAEPDQLHRQLGLTHAQVGACGHVHRQAITPGQGPDAFDVIRMLVGYQDRRELMRAEPGRGQPLFGGAQAEAAIHQQPGPTIFNQSGVTPTATPE